MKDARKEHDKLFAPKMLKTYGGMKSQSNSQKRTCQDSRQVVDNQSNSQDLEKVLIDFTYKVRELDSKRLGGIDYTIAFQKILAAAIDTMERNIKATFK